MDLDPKLDMVMSKRMEQPDLNIILWIWILAKKGASAFAVGYK
jgi:hypothetical protein